MSASVFIGSLGPTSKFEANADVQEFVAPSTRQYLVLCDRDLMLSTSADMDDDDSFLLTAGAYATIELQRGEPLYFTVAASEPDGTVRFTGVG
jgi:hypothetical protein